MRRTKSMGLGGLVGMLAVAIALLVLASGAHAATVPGAPTTLAVSGIGTTNATLTWTQSSGGGIVNNTVQLYSGSSCSGTPTLYSTNGSKTSFDVKNLNPGTDYAATVTSWNATGQSLPSACAGWMTEVRAAGVALPNGSEGYLGLVLAAIVGIPVVILLVYALWNDRR